MAVWVIFYIKCNQNLREVQNIWCALWHVGSVYHNSDSSFWSLLAGTQPSQMPVQSFPHSGAIQIICSVNAHFYLLLLHVVFRLISLSEVENPAVRAVRRWYTCSSDALVFCSILVKSPLVIASSQFHCHKNVFSLQFLLIIVSLQSKRCKWV